MSELSDFPVGSIVKDGSRDRIGRVMSHDYSRAWLRPVGGGTEWTAAPGSLERVTGEPRRCAHCGQTPLRPVTVVILTPPTGERKLLACPSHTRAVEFGPHLRAAVNTTIHRAR
ncbi:hypothetical protein [Streptomyces sp. URMC 129]|uniref:hypothetical protein n=1 Tax=Streptomyces sp. URMC 129 TaxID=3423407 RepID=UPI003F1BCC77